MRSHILRCMAAARRAAAVNRELKQLAVIGKPADGYVSLRDTPPQTYGEFLIRTRRPPRHEPSASDRLAGHPVR